MQPAVWHLVLLIGCLFRLLECLALWRDDWVPALALWLMNLALVALLALVRTRIRSPRAGASVDAAVRWLLWQDCFFYALLCLVMARARLYCGPLFAVSVALVLCAQRVQAIEQPHVIV